MQHDTTWCKLNCVHPRIQPLDDVRKQKDKLLKFVTNLEISQTMEKQHTLKEAKFQ